MAVDTYASGQIKGRTIQLLPIEELLACYSYLQPWLLKDEKKK
jgi:hypothetical protein